MGRSKVNLDVPLLGPLLGFIAGIFMARAGCGALVGIAAIIAAMIFYEFLLRGSSDPVLGYSRRHLHKIWLLTAFIGAGIIVTDFSRPHYLQDSLPDDAEIAIGHVREISFTTNGDRAIVEINAVADSIGRAVPISPCLIKLYSKALDAGIDDNIIFPLNPVPVENSAASSPAGYAEYMKRHGILYTCRADDSEIQVSSHNATWRGRLILMRQDIEAFIENCHLQRPTQEFLITILLGDRAYLRPEVKQLFADAGVSHMLALSGMHVSVIAGILLWMLLPLSFVGRYRLRYVLALPLLWFYALITGMNPSTMRAAVMTTCMIIALLTERRNSAWNSLLLSALIILIADTQAISDVGFQLSFICVASLIFFAGPLNPIDHRNHPMLFRLFSAVLVTITATVASWAIISHYFGIIPTTFIPANLIALPLLPAYIVVALVYFILNLAGFRASLLGSVLDTGYDRLLSALNFIHGDRASVIDFTVPALTVLLWLAAILLAAVWLHAFRRKGVLASALVSAIGALAVIPVYADEMNSPKASIHGGADMPVVQIRTNSAAREFIPEANAVTETVLLGRRYIFTDTKAIAHEVAPGCDYLVITRSCLSSIPELAAAYRPKRLVIHTTVPRRRESLIMKQADSLHIPVHSLRLNGALTAE